MASRDGSDLQVHPKLPQTGSVGWNLGRALARWRRGGKKQKVRAYSAWGTFWHHGVDCQTLLTGGASVWMHDGKSYAALPVCNKASHHYRQQKALLEPQTQRCAKGRGLCQGSRTREAVGRKLDKRTFKIIHVTHISLMRDFISKAESGNMSSRLRACKCGSGWREKSLKHRGYRSPMGDVGTFLGCWLYFRGKLRQTWRTEKDARPAMYFVCLRRQIGPCVLTLRYAHFPRWKKPPNRRLNIINIKLCWRHEIKQSVSRLLEYRRRSA